MRRRVLTRSNVLLLYIPTMTSLAQTGIDWLYAPKIYYTVSWELYEGVYRKQNNTVYGAVRAIRRAALELH